MKRLQLLHYGNLIIQVNCYFSISFIFAGMTNILIKNALVELGKELQDLSTTKWQEIMQLAYLKNRWFTPENTHFALTRWAFGLTDMNLTAWLQPYNLPTQTPKKVGIAMAGNIPLVGLHDLVCVLLAGHIALIKPSQDDNVLISAIAQTLIGFEPSLAEKIIFVEHLKEADAYIATGSDNTARYFEYYFKEKPHIIRKNRVSVAVLKGTETVEDFEMLAEDVMQYFGLGCRSIAKIFAPKDYDFIRFWEAIEPYKDAFWGHTKYANNYEYQRAAYLINSIIHLDNNFMILRETTELASPTGVMYCSFYEDVAELEAQLAEIQDKLQVIVSKDGWFKNSIHFAQAQQPELWDYADGIDTLAFLMTL